MAHPMPFRPTERQAKQLKLLSSLTEQTVSELIRAGVDLLLEQYAEPLEEYQTTYAAAQATLEEARRQLAVLE